MCGGSDGGDQHRVSGAGRPRLLLSRVTPPHEENEEFEEPRNITFNKFMVQLIHPHAGNDWTHKSNKSTRACSPLCGSVGSDALRLNSPPGSDLGAGGGEAPAPGQEELRVRAEAGVQLQPLKQHPENESMLDRL